MSGRNAAMADEVMENVRGSTAAQKLIHDMRAGRAAADAMLEAIRAAGDGARLRGFARELQKAFERAGQPRARVE